MKRCIDIDAFLKKYQKLLDGNREFLKKSRVPDKTEGYIQCQEETIYLLNQEPVIEVEEGEKNE